MLLKEAPALELHPDIESFRSYILEKAGELIAKDSLMDPETAFLITAQAVVGLVRGLYARAETGTTDQDVSFRNHLISIGNWPPRPIPDYFVPVSA